MCITSFYNAPRNLLEPTRCNELPTSGDHPRTVGVQMPLQLVGVAENGVDTALLELTLVIRLGRRPNFKEFTKKHITFVLFTQKHIKFVLFTQKHIKFVLFHKDMRMIIYVSNNNMTLELTLIIGKSGKEEEVVTTQHVKKTKYFKEFTQKHIKFVLFSQRHIKMIIYVSYNDLIYNQFPVKVPITKFAAYSLIVF